MRIEEVLQWLVTTTSKRALPPMFALQPPGASEEASTALFRDLGMRFTRQNPSGTLELRTATNEFLRLRDPLPSILGIARREDPQREISPLRQSHEGSQFLVAQTSIESLPVIGPGGKILVRRSETSLAADITIRRRQLSPVLSEPWNEPGRVYRSLLSEVAEYENEVDIEPTIGYFERSKYHVQRLLRPTFLFVIRPRDQGTAESRSVWETTHIVPATWNPALEIPEQWEIFE